MPRPGGYRAGFLKMNIDLSNLDFALVKRVDEILRRQYDAKLAAACRRQARIAARNHLHRPRSRDGFGEKVIEVDPVFDAHWRQCYGHDYTANKDLLKFLLKRNPEIGVRCTGTKLMVGYAAGSGSRKPVGTSKNGAPGGHALP